MTEVPFLRPTFPAPDDVAEDYRRIVASGIHSNGGPMERALTAAVASWVGAGTAASLVNNATVGLQLACAATMGGTPGRQAIVASFTFAAGPLALRWCGLEPVFIDIHPDTWQPDIESARRILERCGDRVAGILLTNTFGVADEAVDEWERLAATAELPLVIDAAAGFGSEYADGARVGASGACEVFSLHATKTFAVGEGGLVTSRDGALIERLDRMKNFGFGADGAAEVGTNAKLAELPAAIGLRQLAVLPERLARRRAVHQRYVDALAPLGVRFQPGAERSALAFVTGALPVDDVRDDVIAALAAVGVTCRRYYHPLVHLQPAFRDAEVDGDLPATQQLARRVISLPMADDLDADVARRVADVTAKVLDHG